MLKIIDYKPLVGKGQLVGYVDVLLEKTGFIIRRIKRFSSDKGEWYHFHNFKDENEQWVPLNEYQDKAIQEQFFAAVKKELKEFLDKNPTSEEIPF